MTIWSLVLVVGRRSGHFDSIPIDCEILENIRFWLIFEVGWYLAFWDTEEMVWMAFYDWRFTNLLGVWLIIFDLSSTYLGLFV